MNELLKRSIFGLLFLAIVFGPYAADVRYQLTTFPIVLFLFSMIGTRELYTMSKAAGYLPQQKITPLQDAEYDGSQDDGCKTFTV